MTSGWYDLLWLDTETGETVAQKSRTLSGGGDITWKKPASVGNEIALYIKKRY